jgi:hypothetical protein
VGTGERGSATTGGEQVDTDAQGSATMEAEQNSLFMELNTEAKNKRWVIMASQKKVDFDLVRFMYEIDPKGKEVNMVTACSSDRARTHEIARAGACELERLIYHH